MKYKNMAIIGPAHPYRGGMAAFNESLARALQESGNRVDIINFTFQYPNWIFPGEKQTTDDPAPADLSIKRKIHSINPINWWQVNGFLKKANYDHIICGYWIPLLSPCFTTVLKSLHKHSRVTGLIHNAIPHEKRLGDRLLTHKFLNQLSDAVVLSEAVAKDLYSFNLPAQLVVQRLFHPVYNVYGEVEDKRDAKIALKLDTSKRYLLFFGFIRTYKGLDLLIRAFSKANIPEDVDLLIAGEFYDNREKYLKLIADSNRQQRMHLREGYIPKEEVKHYFCASEAVVLPYRNATQSGITQIAIHFSVPVISTKVGGIEEYIQDDVNGLLTAGNIDVLAKDLQRLFDKGVLERYGKGQKDAGRKYSWSAFVDNIV